MVFDVIAGTASIIGLLFSILAFVQAKRASKAAREARDAVMLRSVAETLELSCQRAEQLSDLLQHDRLDEASMRVADLMPAVVELRHRGASYLPNDAAEILSVIQVQLFTIREQLAADSRDELDIAGRKRRILATLHKRIITPLQELLARTKARLDHQSGDR